MLLVNARDVKSVPGRKTDVSDAAWLADLGAHGLLRASFVPPEPIRQLRDLTRARTHITQGRTREIQRLEKLLESAGIKTVHWWPATSPGSRAGLMLQALIDSQGTADPAVMADLGQTPDAVQDPGVDRGVERQVHRPSRVHDPAVPGPD